MYYGQLDLDKVIHERFFQNKRDGFFVECGAYDGLVESTCKFFEESMGWKGLNIEPVPYTFERLIKNRPNSINENLALSSKNGVATFTNPIHPTLGRNFGCGSIKHSPIHWKSIEGCEMDIFEVKTVIFEDLYKKHSLPDIDLFVLDVEGHELDALPSILSIPDHALPKVFCIEHTIVDMNDDWLVKMLADKYNYHSSSYHNVFFIKK
jgi:FkbM family methyltransferase